MAHVELLYDAECPNVERARERLVAAFKVAGIEPRWSEHRPNDAMVPARRYGSPTILVDGRDVATADAGAEQSCRLYRGEDGALTGAPSIEVIASALIAAGPSTKRSSAVRRNLAIVPGIATSLLPKVACPACWPAYAGLMSSLGLGFLLNTAYLIPLTVAFLAIAVGALAFHAKRRRGYKPAMLGVVAAGVVLVGKFGFDSDALMYLGLGVLVGASLWNTWPGKQRIECGACVRSRA